MESKEISLVKFLNMKIWTYVERRKILDFFKRHQDISEYFICSFKAVGESVENPFVIL
jgi:hypothetical protein